MEPRIGLYEKAMIEAAQRRASWAANTARQKAKAANRAAASLKRSLQMAARNPINPAARVPQMWGR